MKIVYFAPIPYDGLRQRPQYLADGLGRVHEVVYVDPTVSMMKYLLRGGERPNGFTRREGVHLTVRRLSGVCSAHRSLEGLWRGFGFPEKLQLRPLLRDADLVWIGFAPWFDLLGDFPRKIVYDRMDDNARLTKNPLLRRLIFKTEPALMRRADVLFVTAQKFYEDLIAEGLHPILVPNAVDWTQAAVCAPVEPSATDVRTFGYVGMLAHWFDLDAVRAVLDAAPENRVVLVGPEEIQRIDDPRVRYVGPVPKAQVGAWIASFDVCLYPFQSTALLDTINPVKLYEYLAQNKPVLAVQSRETAAFGGLVTRYETMEQLRALATQPLRAPFGTDAERQAFVAANDWNARIKTILGGL